MLADMPPCSYSKLHRDRQISMLYPSRILKMKEPYGCQYEAATSDTETESCIGHTVESNEPFKVDDQRGRQQHLSFGAPSVR